MKFLYIFIQCYYNKMFIHKWIFDIIMDACETYARKWAKKEDVELDTLSEWIKVAYTSGRKWL